MRKLELIGRIWTLHAEYSSMSSKTRLWSARPRLRLAEKLPKLGGCNVSKITAKVSFPVLFPKFFDRIPCKPSYQVGITHQYISERKGPLFANCCIAILANALALATEAGKSGCAFIQAL